MKDKFSTNHPETNLEDFEKNVIDPIYNSLTSFGAKEIPKDFFEIIYFGTNRQKVIKEEVDKALKNYVKKTPQTQVKKSGASPNTQSAEERYAERAVKGLGEDTGTKVRFR